MRGERSTTEPTRRLCTSFLRLYVISKLLPGLFSQSTWCCPNLNMCGKSPSWKKNRQGGWGCKLLSSGFFGLYCIPFIPNHRRRWMPLEKPKYLVIFASAYGCLGNRHSSKPHEESPLVALSHAIKTDFFVSFRFKLVTSCIIIWYVHYTIKKYLKYILKLKTIHKLFSLPL